ncbi:GNAT family N-acetyltransferase [Nocardia transvalensis]|uniref:GNAT family N-acetyltransferase n=1 Tax=Nocardia transvalensis TaxID=37333 RepID=UPI001893A330|nr:GNAT family N-acetyltransferase [Nocardia transvalensis]MBF6328039.1 GNAT family N-acetyltransferase [Nocardia transvalensis]
MSESTGAPIRIVPATRDRFDDVATMLAPKRPGADACWCLSYRLPSKENNALTGPARRDRMHELCAHEPSPGLLAYDGDQVVGWTGVAPRDTLAFFAHSTRIPHVDDLPVWTVWCFKVRPGHRGRGITTALLHGAVDYARSHGAPAIEGYPADNRGRKVDTTLAFVGTVSLFERAGFTRAAATTATSAGFPRVLMRLALR